MRAEIVEQLRAEWRARHPAIWREAVRRRKKRSVVQHAREVRKMRGGPIAGVNTIPFSTEFCPHTIEQMEACDDPSVNLIVIWGPIRDMKTTAALCAIGRTVTDDPGGIYSVWPTDADVKKFSEDDLDTMIDTSPEISRCFVAKKSRDSGRTITYKKYKGGSIRLPSAGSVTAFRGSTVKVLHLPEADALNPESIYKAFGRTTGIADAIKIMESTGTLASETGENDKVIWHSVIAEHYDQSDQRKWFVECEHCRGLSVILYAQLRADSGGHAEAKWHCPKCDHGHDATAWFRAAQTGKWYPTAGLTTEELLDIRAHHHKAKAKRPEVRGYWRNGFNSLLDPGKGYATKLHEFMAEGEVAKGSQDKLKTWTNEIAAELWDPAPLDTSPPAWQPMYDRREAYDVTVPERGLFLTSFTDVHDNRLEVAWQAWGRNEESWVMDHVVLQGSVFQPAVWRLWRRELGRSFEHAFGCNLGLGFGLIDGGDNAEAVYRALQDLVRNPEPGVSGKIRASRGLGMHPHPIIDTRWQTVAKTLKGHHIGTWQAKKLLYTERFRMVPIKEFCDGRERLTGDPTWDVWDGEKWIPDPRFGVMHFNLRTTQEFHEQTVRERPSLEYIKGEQVMKFDKKSLKSNTRNEGLDLLVGNLAAVRFYARPWDLLEADLRAQARDLKDKQAVFTSATPTHPARSPIGRGWSV